MRRKVLTLCAAVAVALLAAGGASAADLSHAEELAPENENDSGAEAGICVVGVDSPCSGEEAETRTDGQIADNGSEKDGQMWIPEDQNRDGEIDNRFGCEPVTHPTPQSGDEISPDSANETEGQILLPEDQNHDGKIDERFGGSESDETQIMLPEDQNRDGEIDDRFTETPLNLLGGFLTSVFGLF
jgi:hypothetical protein